MLVSFIASFKSESSQFIETLLSLLVEGLPSSFKISGIIGLVLFFMGTAAALILEVFGVVGSFSFLFFDLVPLAIGLKYDVLFKFVLFLFSYMALMLS